MNLVIHPRIEKGFVWWCYWPLDSKWGDLQFLTLNSAVARAREDGTALAFEKKNHSVFVKLGPDQFELLENDEDIKSALVMYELLRHA